MQRNEGTEYIAEQEKFGVAVGAAANGGNGSVENHYRMLESYIDSPVGTLPKSGTRNSMDSNITKLDETLLLITLTLEESPKSFQTQQDERYKFAKKLDRFQEKSSQMKIKFKEIKPSKIELLAELKPYQRIT